MVSAQEGWQDLLSGVDGDAMIAEALSAMDADDLSAAFRRLPPKIRNDFLSDLRLPEMRNPRPVVLRQALQRLARKPSWFQKNASVLLTAGVLGPLDLLAEELPTDEHGIQRAEWEERVLGALRALSEEIPQGVLRLSVAVAVAEKHRLAGPLIAVASDDNFSTFQSPRKRPARPGKSPVEPSSDIDEEAQQADERDPKNDGFEANLAIELEGLFDEGAKKSFHRSEIDLLRESVTELDLEASRHAAEQILDRLNLGARPSETDLGTLNEFVESFDAIWESLTVLLPDDPVDETLEALLGSIELLVNRTKSVDQDLLLAKLSQVEGPNALGVQLSALRSAALACAVKKTAPETEGLVALALIIEASSSADEVDDERLIELDLQARKALPPHLQSLLMPAARGRLRLPSGAEPPHHAETGEEEADTPTLSEAKGRYPVVDQPAIADKSRTSFGSVDKDDAETTGTKKPDVGFDNATDLHLEESSPSSPLSGDPESPAHSEITQSLAEQDPETNRESDWVSPEIQGVVARLIEERRLGLASWIAEAAGAPFSTTSGLRLVAYGDAIRTATGGCAGRLSEVSGDLRLRDLEGWVSFLVFTTALRSALLAPFSGAQSLLDEVSPAVSEFPNLSAVADIVYRAALRGTQVMNASDAAMAGVASLETEVADTIELATESLRSGPTRTIKFRRATEIWHDWIAPNGLLGSLLGAVASDRRSERSAVSERILELRNPKYMDKVLSDADKNHRDKSVRIPVIAGARANLMERAREVVELVAAWLDAVDRLEQFREAGAGVDWQRAPVAELREQLRPYRESALAELDRLVLEGDILISAAGRAAKLSLEATFAIFDGVPLAGNEPPPDELINQELLKLPEVELEGLYPVGNVPLPAILSVAAGRSWTEAFEERSAAGDHATTGLIIEALRDSESGLGTSLSRRRDEARRTDETTLRLETAALLDDLARSRRQGYINEEAWSEFSARLETVSQSSQQNFGRLRQHLELLRMDLQEARTTASASALERLAAKRQVDKSIREVADRIETLIRDGHLATADEFLALAENGDELPSADQQRDDFAIFWPPVVESMAKKPIDATMAEAVKSGQAWEGTVDFSHLTPSRREISRHALEAWASYKSGPKGNKYLVGLKDAFALTGVEADSEIRPPDVQSSGKRLWLELVGVRRIGKALVPTFGTLCGGIGGDRLRVVLVWGQPSAVDLIEMVALDTSQRPVMVLYFGTLPVAERQSLSELTRRRRSKPVAVLDDAVLAFLASNAESRYDTLMAAVLPFTAINPYTPRVAGDVPLEMFYGRTEELHQVIDPFGTSFIYGGRQLGKSSLLQAAARRFDNGLSQRAIYVDLKREGIGRTRLPVDLWDFLWGQLAQLSIISPKKPISRDVPQRLIAGVGEWLDAQSDRRILLLLDECDDFLEADAGDGFPTVSRLKGLLEDTQRRCKPVFAGLHQVQRFQHIPNQPLAHLGRPVSIGPLRPKAAFDLLDQPMRALGYRFASDELINRILAYCNNQPSLLQLFGEAVVNRLIQAPVAAGAPPHAVSEEDVESAYASRALIEEFRHRFELTLQLDLRYKVIAHTMAYNAHEAGPAALSDPVELRSECERWWPKGFSGIPSDEFRALLGEMVGLGVLSESEDGFRMRSPNVLRMLGTSDQIVERLLDAENYLLPEPFQAASFRRQLGSTNRRAPLNEAQLAQILARRNQCLVVAGSRALGISQVADAIKASRSPDDAFKSFKVAGKSIPQAEAMTTTGKHRLLVADMTELEAAWAVSAITTARATVAKASGGTLGIVALSSPRQATLWADLMDPGQSGTEAVRLVELRRWDLAGLRMWMRDAELPFQDEDARREFLAVTGGWPILVDRVVESLTTESRNPQTSLATLSSYLSTQNGANQLINAVGVAADPQVAKVWDTLVDLDEPAFHDELIGLLADDVGDQSAALVNVLRVLGTLVTTKEGRFACEPILTNAWRTAKGD